MPHFKAKMHQIRFRLGLPLRPRWGSFRRFPAPFTWILEVLLIREKVDGKEEKGRDSGRKGTVS